MSYDTGTLSKIKKFESKHSSSVVVGGVEKEDIKEHYDEFKKLQQNIEDDKETITNYDQIQDIYNIYDIDKIFKKINEEFEITPQDKIKQYNDYIVATNNLLKASIDNNIENIEKYTQEHCNLVNEIDAQQIEIQASMLASIKSGNSMLSSMSGADSKKMASSIMTSMSKLNDGTKLLQDKKLQSRPQKDEKQIQCILNAFIGLYNNYYDTQKAKEKNTQKQKKLNEHQTKEIKKVNKKLKKSIEILLYPTERDKKPNPEQENKSNYDISLEKFNNFIGDICKKYNVENINELIQKTSGTDIRKFARQIQSLQMCCAAMETQEMFMENGLGAGIF